jgi:hypothetical protein
VEQDIHQRVEYFQIAIVLDEAKLAERIHEEVDASAGGANHFGEDCLADLGHNGFRLAGLAEASEEKESSEALFAGVEELIDEVGFNLGVAFEKELEEAVVEAAVALKGFKYATLGMRMTEQSVSAVAVMRVGWPTTVPSPRKSPAPRRATTASLPRLETVESLIAHRASLRVGAFWDLGARLGRGISLNVSNIGLGLQRRERRD